MKTFLTFMTATVFAALVEAQPEATNQDQKTHGAHGPLSVTSAMDVRLFALGQIESGGNDLAVGSHGEVSRYQIMPEVWRKYAGKLPLSSASNTFTAANCVKAVISDRQKLLICEPSDVQWFLLWHCPAHVNHPDKTEYAAAMRFQNLCQSQKSN